MEKNYSQIYRDSILHLVASIVIKTDQAAQAINNGLFMTYGPGAVNLTDRSTWKYYLNISGEYHPTDTRMTIKSMDTLEAIEFSKANLAVHRSTAKGYAFGTNPYKELVNKFPNQEMLIRGILYPADLTTAIAAAEGTILAYPESLVEPYEYSLIINLQSWIYGFIQRWDNQAYNISDELYHASMLGVLYSCMIGSIYCLRKEACKTNEVHSYHLRNYLASHGVEKYLNYLTREQALWLYRNITYIERYAGHQNTFDWLVENLFTKRSLPLAAYEMRHDLSDLVEGDLKPRVTFHKNELNGIASDTSREAFTFEEIFDKENPLALDNLKYRDVYDLPTALRMENSKSNVLKIKLLETSMINPEGSEKFLLEEVRFYQWLHMAHTGKYRAVVPFTSPVTAETTYLTSIDAFALYTYIFCALQGVTLGTMPQVTAKRVLRVPRPTLTDILSVATARVPQSFGQLMLDLMPAQTEIISIDLFAEYCVEVWKCANRQWYNVCAEEAMDVRGMKHAVAERCWCDQRIQLGTVGQTYSSFFAANNLDIGTYSESELQIAHDTLLQSAVGVKKTDETALVGVQRAMTEILTQLSSYSIQISRDINATGIRDVGQTAIRTDNGETRQFGYRGIEPEVGIEKVTSRGKLQRFDDMGSSNVPITFQTRVWGDVKVKSGINLTSCKQVQASSMNVNTGSDVSWVLPPLPEEFAHLTNYPGLAQYLALTEEQKRLIPINIF